MAFENHQQDAFNLRNDTESLKQWQSELDKATTSIGAAEVAAEEELAALKFKNLSALQDARVAKLEQLIALEDKGIRELARARLTLSNRQFELRKKEIQREFRLLKAAADKLQEPSKKAKKPEADTGKQTSKPKKDAPTSNAKSVSVVKKDSAKHSKKATGDELSSLAKSFDKTLSSLQNTATRLSKAKEIDVVADIKSDSKSQQPAAMATKNIQATSKSTLVEEVASVTKEHQEATKVFETEASRSKISEVPQPNIDVIEKAPLKEPETKTQPELINLVSSIDKTLGSLLATVSKQPKEKDTSTEEDKRSSTTDDIKAEADQRARKGSGSATPPTSNGAGISKNTPEKNFSSDTSGLEKVVLDTSELKTTFLNDFSSVLNSGDLVKAIKQINTTVKSYTSYTEQRKEELSASMKSANAEKLKGFDPKVAMEKAKQAEQEAAKAASEKAYKEAQKAGKTKEEAKVIADKAGKDAGDKARKASLKKTKDDYKALSDLVKKEQDKAEKKAIKEAKKAGLSAEEAEAAGKAARKKVTQESVLDANAEASAKLTANFEMLAEAAGGLAATLDAKVKEISSMQGIVDTRLQGSRTNDRDFGNGSYWNELLEDAKKIAGASPFVKQEKLVDNIKVLVERGISFDIKQRAFLMTIQEKIANTFNAADGTLLRLIRIQQQDTTAGRLGMESALNSFLNSMYETSEYLEGVAANVRGSLEEMQALMEGAAGTELEFQVQKWMGSLYSVGMSQDAVQSIAQTFGQIASGDIGGLTGSGTGNLLIMAANEAGMSIADILQDGLNADETNKLMQAMVNYLAEIAETASDSRVVQQQLANVYGVKASDLRAATNLATSIKDVSNQDLTYSGMLGQLEHMMNTIRLRTSIGEGMTNMWDNVLYSMASTQASNPILYALPKMADLLRDVTGGGGIALPFLNVMGFGVDLNTSVADLMSVASMAGTALGALGPLFTGIADLVNPMVGSSMLRRAGINTSGKAPVIARGSAQPLQHLGGSSISESGLVGNADGKSIKEQTLQGAEDDKKKQMIKAKDEESADDTATKANFAVVNIYNLLEEVAHGSQSLRVRVINNNSGGAGGSSGGSNYIIGDDSGTGSTGAGGGGTDNGNWVLTF